MRHLTTILSICDDSRPTVIAEEELRLVLEAGDSDRVERAGSLLEDRILGSAGLRAVLD
jgi:hypothetical protein